MLVYGNETSVSVWLGQTGGSDPNSRILGCLGDLTPHGEGLCGSSSSCHGVERMLMEGRYTGVGKGRGDKNDV